MAEAKETITLIGSHDIGDGQGAYGPGEVTVAPHIAELLRRMDVPHAERAEAERAARREARRKDGGGA